MKKQRNNKPTEDENNRISERVVQYVDDPKNSSALAKIHEMSNKAKRTGKSPTQLRRSYFEKKAMDPKEDKNFNRRSSHFATVKQDFNLNLFNKNINTNLNPPKDEKKERKDKKEFVWDKSNNNRFGGKDSRKFKNEPEPIKEDKEKEEKVEIIEKLREYRKKKENEAKNKKIKIQVPKGNDKFSEIVYEKKILPENEDEEDLKESSGSKNTRFYKKIVKNAPGSKTVITKKVIEENIEQTDEKLNFDNDSDDEDIKRELQKLKLNPSQLSKGNIKVKIITEEYDEKGNKIYSKEYTTNKLPKGLKGNDEIMDEFEKFEDEFDE
jgi:hypothetical protein